MTQASNNRLVVRHPDGQSEDFPLSETGETIVRVGRELDNDVVLDDPRSSRYHLEIRYNNGSMEIKDLNSANGVTVDGSRIEPDMWVGIDVRQVTKLGETRIRWETGRAVQSTKVMTPIQREAAAIGSIPQQLPQHKKTLTIPLIIGGGVALVVLILLVLLLMSFISGGTPAEDVAGQQPTSEATILAGRSSDTNLKLQTPGSPATTTPTPTGPQLAIPVIEIVSLDVLPIVLGAVPDPNKGNLLVNIRVQNVGNAPFTISTGDFLVRTTTTGQVFDESGQGTSLNGLRRLGAIDRFDNLTLTSGGSVAESLLFELKAEIYDLELLFNVPEIDPPVIMSLGVIDAGQKLAMALGTPIAQETVAVAATPTLKPTPTATRPALIPAPQVVPRSALVGTIAYPVFNGNSFDLYFGNVQTGERKLFRNQSSQPAFSPDGSRIALHSWSGDSRGLVTMDVSGANMTLVANFLEDQLPTWTADGQDILFLSRRSGGRQSQLIRANGSTEFDKGVIVGEGEYPTIGQNGQLVFKGWGITAYGLRVSSPLLGGIQTVTNVNEDTAPSLSPDGSKVVFMSRREENWDIYIINTDGTKLKRLTIDIADDGLPTWSPKGNAIAFLSNRGGPWAVWAMTPEGDGTQQLFTVEGSPDGMVGTDSYVSRGWAEERMSWTQNVNK